MKDDASWCLGTSTAAESSDWCSDAPSRALCKQHCLNGERGWGHSYPLTKWKNVFVQIAKCICMNWVVRPQTELSKWGVGVGPLLTLTHWTKDKLTSQMFSKFHQEFCMTSCPGLPTCVWTLAEIAPVSFMVLRFIKGSETISGIFTVTSPLLDHNRPV